MWKMLDRAFFERSPSPYMRTPQATAQYGHVLRVSVARASLNSRTSAIAAVGEKPSSARLDPARVALVTFRNSRRVTSAMSLPLDACRPAESIPLREGATRQPGLVRGDACLPFCYAKGQRAMQRIARLMRSFAARLVLPVARWQSGHAAACKAVYAGSIPTLASISASAGFRENSRKPTKSLKTPRKRLRQRPLEFAGIRIGRGVTIRGNLLGFPRNRGNFRPM